MTALEFWIWREQGGFVVSDGDHRLVVETETQATDVAVRIAQQCDALYRIFYARYIAD